MEDGLWLMLQGKYEEALEAFLWCWDHGAEVDPYFYPSRQTTLLRYMKQLRQVYPACAEALDERKSAIREQLKTAIYPGRLRSDLEALEREGIWRGFQFPESISE